MKKLYYVEHSVVTKMRFALIAENEEEVKEELKARELKFKTLAFKSKIEKVSYPLNKDWDSFKALPWDGKTES